MESVTAAVIQCSECDCTSMYQGPLDVGATVCSACNHQMNRHVIRSHAATPVDAATGAMAEDFELFPRFR